MAADPADQLRSLPARLSSALSDGRAYANGVRRAGRIEPLAEGPDDPQSGASAYGSSLAALRRRRIVRDAEPGAACA